MPGQGKTPFTHLLSVTGPVVCAGPPLSRLAQQGQLAPKMPLPIPKAGHYGQPDSQANIARQDQLHVTQLASRTRVPTHTFQPPASAAITFSTGCSQVCSCGCGGSSTSAIRRIAASGTRATPSRCALRRMASCKQDGYIMFKCVRCQALVKR